MVENEVSGQSDFWITGGKLSNTRTDTTEIVSLTESKVGVTLPFSVYKHCLVKVNSSTIVLIGGWNGRTSGETWFFHTNTEPWQKVRGPDLNIARIYPGCQVYDFQDDKYLVVTGGYKMLSTEFLNVKNTAWIQGKLQLF